MVFNFDKQLAPDISSKAEGCFRSENAFPTVIMMARREQAIIQPPVFKINGISLFTIPTSTTSAINVGK